MSIGSQLQKYRKAAGLGYPQMADRSGVSVGTINALEKRGSKRSEFWGALAEALGLSIEELTDESTDYTDRVKEHVQTQKYPIGPEKLGWVVTEIPSKDLSGKWWPFSVSKDRIQAALSADDIALIDTYILGIVQVREADRLKNRG
jgi:transcriptional regulator with XRE-family HTH domain